MCATGNVLGCQAWHACVVCRPLQCLCISCDHCNLRKPKIFASLYFNEGKQTRFCFGVMSANGPVYTLADIIVIYKS